jgi:uncharacterized protein YuzB (UPF0349 family)
MRVSEMTGGNSNVNDVLEGDSRMEISEESENHWCLMDHEGWEFCVINLSGDGKYTAQGLEWDYDDRDVTDDEWTADTPEALISMVYDEWMQRRVVDATVPEGGWDRLPSADE